MSWVVLHVRPRCEKKMADLCRAHGIAHYLPLRSVTRCYQRRRVEVELPLFSGYCFVKVESSKRLILLRSNHIVRTLQPEREWLLLRQLVQVRRALRADPSMVSTRPIKRGALVRIVTGPCRGLEGVVEHLKGQKSRLRVVLNVDLIGQAVAVEAAASDVELL